LRRLAERGESVVRIALDSTTAIRRPLEQRTLDMTDYPYPIDLARLGDINSLHAALARATAATLRRPGAMRGGNRTKRIRIWLASSHDLKTLGRYLRDGR